jgi:hypothetical protein
MTVHELYDEAHVCHGSAHALTKECLGSAVLAGEYVSRKRLDTFWKRLHGLFLGYK